MQSAENIVSKSQDEKTLLNLLDQHSIEYQLYQHEPAFTVAESDHLLQIIPGTHSKNLFVKDKKNKYFLISVPHNKKVDLTQLSKIIAHGRFSFTNADDLLHYLGLIPGSVTPYGLLNDLNRHVTFVLDKAFLNQAAINFHPLRNDMTISTSSEAFLKFCELVEHKPSVMEIPEISSS